MDKPSETDDFIDQEGMMEADLNHRVDQAENVPLVDAGPPIEDPDGNRTVVLDTIPFEKDYATQSKYIHDASNAATARGATRLEYFLPNEYATANGIKDGDLLGLDFQKTETNPVGSTWHKPVYIQK